MTTTKKPPLKVNISLNPEAMELLTKYREILGKKLGFVPTYSQTIKTLIRDGKK